MTDTKTKTDRRDLQRRVLRSELFNEVTSTADALRHGSEYDVGNAGERAFAILCYALEQSALHTDGTSLTLAGVYRTLNVLKEEA